MIGVERLRHVTVERPGTKEPRSKNLRRKKKGEQIRNNSHYLVSLALTGFIKADKSSLNRREGCWSARKV